RSNPSADQNRRNIPTKHISPKQNPAKMTGFVSGLKRALSPLFRKFRNARLALGELEGTTCLGATVLLALDHAAVAGEEAALLEDAAQLRLEIGESLGDAVANRTGLAGKAATDDGCNDVVLVDAISGNDRLLQDHLKNRTCEILCAFLAVHGDLARTRLDPDTSNRVLALAGCVGTAL